MRNLISAFLCSAAFVVQSQSVPIAEKYVDHFWEAQWLCHPDGSAFEYGVYHFRKTIELDSKPDQFIVHVSADNRYKLYVNGTEVSIGPARGDLEHWRFESVDIAEFLQAGKNVLASVVWNFGEHSPVAQISNRTAFILQGNGEKESIVSTDNSWKVYQNTSYSPEKESQWALRAYLVVGPGDVVDGSSYPWGWRDLDFDDSGWIQPRTLGVGQTFGRGTDGNWRLVPRKIPAMENYETRFGKIRRTENITILPQFLSGQSPISIPANQNVSFLLDQEHLTIGYPKLLVSGGSGATIRVSYGEALFGEGDWNKGNRDVVEGKEMRGYTDIFYPDGGENRLFETLWNRTWRYAQVEVETGTEPLSILDFSGQFSAFPFVEKATFSSDQPWLGEVWNVGWRTARLCAGETYFDCPYYEQMQYVGDTRIQALISLYVAGDDRLMRRAIDDFDQSREWNGLTHSRYPSSKLQFIPPYSLFWIAMIHDHWMHVGDEAYVRSMLPGIESVLGWYENQLNSNGLLGDMKWWHFTDWALDWPWNPADRIGGVPAMDGEGNSSVLAFQYAYALQYAEALFQAMGQEEKSRFYKKNKEDLISSLSICWNEQKGLFSDVPEQQIFSQHANILAILTDAVSVEEQNRMMTKILEDTSLIQATFYFKFYLTRALVKTGMADEYLNQLEPWRDMLDMGLTTFAEQPDPTRSDCHAWSASPSYDLLATVGGITSSAPGFKSVRIEPALGSLTSLQLSMPHPKGEITINYSKKKKKLIVQIDLPTDVSGVFVWKGAEQRLSDGHSELEF